MEAHYELYVCPSCYNLHAADSDTDAVPSKCAACGGSRLRRIQAA